MWLIASLASVPLCLAGCHTGLREWQPLPVETTDLDIEPPRSLGDSDNYEHLYLDTMDTPLRVSMDAGLLMDPRDDPNPRTEAPVSPIVPR